MFLKGLSSVVQKRMGEDAGPLLDSSLELGLKLYGSPFLS